jgi:hypothetical protein
MKQDPKTRGQYIWIARWGDFQHYAPRRDRGPAWIKDYRAGKVGAAQ